MMTDLKNTIILVAGVLLMVGCKKDYVCSCEGSHVRPGFEQRELNNSTKKEAQEACDTFDQMHAGMATCTLK